MNYVIGSGPAATAAAWALVQKGAQVRLIEPGLQLEKENESLKKRLASSEPPLWSEEDLLKYKDGMKPTTKGIPLKKVYRSDFPFREVDPRKALTSKNAKVLRSFAAGGLSNVWGACILPYPTEEISDWPISIGDLAPHYSEILSFVPHAGRKDRLSRFLPLYANTWRELQLGSHALGLLSDLEANAELMERRGFHFGMSRIAVQHDCKHCSLCLYGCPYDKIYATNHTLEALEKTKSLRWMKGYYVERLEPRGAGVDILARNIRDNELQRFRAERVYLGAGLIETARIVMESLEFYERAVSFVHSDRFMMPLLRWRGASLDEPHHTLCQLFVELNDRDIAPESVHLQVYGYNDLYRKALEAKLGPLANSLKLPVDLLLKRLMITFGYLHSNSSSTFDLQLTGDGIEVSGKENPAAKKIMNKVQQKLIRNSYFLGALPGPGRLDPPGGGNHSGGSFPMRRQPGKLECDIWGRLAELPGVHLIDSSVFPSVPGATITLSTMANAHRIASADCH